MKHWDLTPGETVILARQNSDRRISARFLFRDTIHACFSVEDHLHEFNLRQDGALMGREVWRIEGADRFTRHGFGIDTGEKYDA